MTKRSVYLFLFLALLPGNSVIATEDTPLPRHLVLGRTLLDGLAPESTSYRHNGSVRWKGDFLTSRYEAHTDCSGLINSLLGRAESQALYRLGSIPFHVSKAEDYYRLIAHEDGFKRIGSVSDVLPGDIIAVKYLPGHAPMGEAGTGHVMLVDARPVRREKDTRPIVDGARQWEVAVIDSARSPHGKDDTRRRADGSKGDGVGRGVFRLYADEQGNPLGFSWSRDRSSNFYDASSRPLVIGRPLYGSPDPAPERGQPNGPGAVPSERERPWF